ncbi:MAG: hypothetical protein ACRCXK_02410, partial [Wohlfahrtiimonas sp.]
MKTVQEVLDMTPEQRAEAHLDLESKSSNLESKIASKDVEILELKESLKKFSNELAADISELKASNDAKNELDKATI